MIAGKTSVFINCPFDKEYAPLFRAIVFVVAQCGFYPRCALEIIDGAETRIDKIQKLIALCPLGIHDISRTELDGQNSLPRFNMPLELGLFLGAKRYGNKQQRQKKCLVLDREPYRYQKFISDIAGQDVESHGSDVERLIGKVRSFLNSASAGHLLPSGRAIQQKYQQFSDSLPEMCAGLDIDLAMMDYRDFSWLALGYVSEGNGR